MKRITIEFVFDEEVEDDHTFFNLRGVNLVPALTDIGKSECYNIAESWAQSDRYWVDTCNEIIGVIAEGSR